MAQGPLTEHSEAQLEVSRRELKARLSAVRKLLKDPLAKAGNSLAKSDIGRKELAARSQAGSAAGPAESHEPAVTALAKAIGESGLGGSRARKQLLDTIGILEGELLSAGMLAGERGMRTVADLRATKRGPKKGSK
ncbi:MAG: hypothetical protein ACTHN7_04900 [Solirubrobacterales bacterium]